MSRATRAASTPLIRTTPIPPRPGGVAIATMVSSVLNDNPYLWLWTRDLGRSYRLAEMMTVFRNASPMLSDDIDGSSATVRWTRRREYGLSGPIS